MAVLSNDGIRAGASGGTDAYEIARSLRFSKENETWLKRASTSSITDANKWTLSFWMKRGALGSVGLFSGGQGALGWTHTGQGSIDLRLVGDCWYINWTEGSTGSANQWSGEGIRHHRDNAAWGHVVFVFDSGQASNSNRMKIYYNNELFTDYGTQNTMTQNWAPQVLVNNANLTLGAMTNDANGPGTFFDGYMADAYLIDGQALTPSDFAATNSATGAWDPIEYAGTYGNQGWHLTFADNSSETNLGLDSSGNNNHWLPQNFTAGTGAVSVSTAECKPILASSDDYGQNEVTTGTLYNTDSDASDLLLALPFNTNWNDVHATIKGSGTNHTISNTSSGGHSFPTSGTKFYGSCVDIDYRTNDTSPAVVQFGGSNIGLTSSDSGKATIEWWQKMDETTTAYVICDFGVGGNGNNNNGNEGLRIMWDNGTLRIIVNPESDQGTRTYNVDVPTGVDITDWTHIAFTHDQSGWDNASQNSKVYFNGTLKATNTITYGWSTHINNNFYLFNGPHNACGGSNNCWKGFGGSIQDFRVYKKIKYTGNFTCTGPATNATRLEQDSTVESPTSYGTDTGVGGEVRGSYATFNPLQLQFTIDTKHALSQFRGTTASKYNAPKSTIALNKGKWYVEFTPVGSGNNGGGCGIIADGPNGWDAINDNLNYGMMAGSDSAIKQNNGYIYSNGGIVADHTSLSYDLGDVTSVAVDFDAMKIWFGKNGTWGGSGDPANGTNPAHTWTADPTKWWYFIAQSYSDGNPGFGWDINTGSRPWTHTCPSGFKAVCTTNLPALGVKKSTSAFHQSNWSGNGSSAQSIDTGFSPDLVWFKERTSTSSHGVIDRLRGSTNAMKVLYPERTDAQVTASSTTSITSLDSSGFTIGSSDNSINQSGQTYIGWSWDVGASAATASTEGSITPSAQWVNNAAGFSISKYEGTGANATVGHGLSTPPELIIIKNIDNVQPWIVGNSHVHTTAPYAYYMQLNANISATTESTVWNDTAPTNTVFSLGSTPSVNQDNENHIAYCWTSIPGYSKFGLYESNGIDEGPFIYCGFRPALLWIKATNVAGENWYIFSEGLGETYNVRDERLQINSTAAQSTYAGNKHDMLSNGFKIRENYSETNSTTANSTYFYCAWAKEPFKTGRAH